MNVVIEDVIIYTGDIVLDDTCPYSADVDDSNFLAVDDDGIMDVLVEDGVCCT